MKRIVDFFIASWRRTLLMSFWALLASHVHAGPGVGPGIYRYVSGTTWDKIDSHPDTVDVAAANGIVVKRHTDGRLYRLTNDAWEQISVNGATVQVVVGSTIFQRLSDGRIYRFTGVPCAGDWCPGWEMIDNNPSTRLIVGASNGSGGGLFQMHHSGAIFEFTGTVCSGSYCPGWRMLDNNGATAEITGYTFGLYQRHYSGTIFLFNLLSGRPCDNVTCYDWQVINADASTIGIQHGGALLKRRNDGGLFVWTNDTSGQAWKQFDRDLSTSQIQSSGPFFGTLNDLTVYKLRADGSIYRWNQRLCSFLGCQAWPRIQGAGPTIKMQLDWQTLYRLDRY